MKTRLYETPLGKFEEAVYPGDNTCGYKPIGEFVLVLHDKSPEKTAGGIILADTTKENNSDASEAGVIIELGDDAFKWNYDRSRPFNGQQPEPGDRVYFERYAGTIIYGKDGVKYRLMQDRCVAAVAQSDSKEPKASPVMLGFDPPQAA